MKATGIVRRIDDLGRVVIPKEIRKTLRIREADPLEIFTDREGEIILKKYSPIGELGNFAKEYAESLAQTTGHGICITDKDQIIATAGGVKREYVGKQISGSLEELIDGRENVLHNLSDHKYVEILEKNEEKRAQVISPILCEGDAIGAVVLMGKNPQVRMGETESMVARCAANFMGRQLEA
ncbi:MAG: stage V sporulation protein T [Eubacteriales bacterium]|nr:stage V sporulation protein T [Eubacteriales bacterium]